MSSITARIWFARLVAFLAILYSAGNSGGYLNAQEGELSRFAWGYLGALVAGLALLGGVYLGAARGDKLGWGIAVTASIADWLLNWGWFMHRASITPSLLAVWPPLLAVLSGMAEGRMTRSQELAQSQISQERESFDLTQEARDRALERRIRLAQSQTSMLSQPVPEQQNRSHRTRPETHVVQDDTDFNTYLAEHPDATYRTVQSALGFTSVSMVINRANRNGWHKNGNGWTQTQEE